MSIFKRNLTINVRYSKRTGKTTTKTITAEPTAKRNVYRIALDWDEWVDVEVIQ